MAPVRLLCSLRGVVVPALYATISMLTLAAPTAFAASPSGGQPLILDTQQGISDGHTGTVLQTAPLSHERIVQAKPIATPTGLTPNSSVPIVVAPYIQLPTGGGTSTSHSKPQPRSAQSSQ
ncbi:MAG: hypothetical protein ABSD12_27875 [Paraburkholderia sp.]|jgi:hypothetical protein